MNDLLTPKLRAMLISVLEFFILWVASTFPILLGGIFLKLQGEDYLISVYNLFSKDPVFAYTSIMIAPYLFTIVSVLFFQKKLSNTILPSFVLFLAFIIFSVSITLYIYNLSGLSPKHS